VNICRDRLCLAVINFNVRALPLRIETDNPAVSCYPIFAAARLEKIGDVGMRQALLSAEVCKRITVKS